MSEQVTKPILIVGFGVQYAQLTARRVHETKVYSEVIAHGTVTEEIRAKNPTALVLSGGPPSVYAKDASKLNPEQLELGIPVFGICCGFQAVTEILGDTITATGDREYNHMRLNLVDGGGVARAGVPETHEVWMSHGNAVSRAPEGSTVTASTKGIPVAAFECLEKHMAGMQYHPEIDHSPYGQQVLERFLYEIASLEPN